MPQARQSVNLINHQTRAAEIITAIGLPDAVRGDAETVLARIMAGEDSRELADALVAVYLQSGNRDQPQRPDLVRHVLDWPAGPIVYGDALSHCYRDGHMTSLLIARYSKTRVLRWFRGAVPETLMNDEERAVLAALPEQTTAYRGGTGPTRLLRLGMSWTLDPAKAAFFAYRVGMGPRAVIRAKVGRKGVLAYFNSRHERELVLDWKRARLAEAISVETLAEDGAAPEHLQAIASDATLLAKLDGADTAGRRP